MSTKKKTMKDYQAELRALQAENTALKKRASIVVKNDTVYANNTITVNTNRDNDGRFYINLDIKELKSFLSEPECKGVNQLTVSGFIRDNQVKGEAGRYATEPNFWFGERNVSATKFKK